MKNGKQKAAKNAKPGARDEINRAFEYVGTKSVAVNVGDHRVRIKDLVRQCKTRRELASVIRIAKECLIIEQEFSAAATMRDLSVDMQVGS